MLEQFEFNGVTYAITSSLIPTSPDAVESGILFNFSMAVVDKNTGNKQIALNNLSLVRRRNTKGVEFLDIGSPNYIYNRRRFRNGRPEIAQMFCRSIVFIPGMDKLDERKTFIETLIPNLRTAAEKSLRYRYNDRRDQE